MALDDGWIILGELKDGTLFYQCTNCQDASDDSEQVMYYTVACGHEHCLLQASMEHVASHVQMVRDMTQLEMEFPG